MIITATLTVVTIIIKLLIKYENHNNKNQNIKNNTAKNNKDNSNNDNDNNNKILQPQIQQIQ